jgi:hypothetical protein
VIGSRDDICQTLASVKKRSRGAVSHENEEICFEETNGKRTK